MYEGAACLAAPPVSNKLQVYAIPNSLKIMRMTAITIRIWIQPPVRGKLGLMFPPKKPSSHRITRITIIVHNMRFLLLD
jgi:hypothetical protein